MQRRILLDAVILKGIPVNQLFPGKAQNLTLYGNSLFFLDFDPDRFHKIGWFHFINGDVFSRLGFNKNLHGAGGRRYQAYRYAQGKGQAQGSFIHHAFLQSCGINSSIP